MVIFLIITWVLLVLIAVAVIGKNTKSIEELQDHEDGIVKAVKIIQNNSLKTTADLEVTKNEADANSAEIDGIINRMNEICEDLKRLDAQLNYTNLKVNVMYPTYENIVYQDVVQSDKRGDDEKSV